MAVALGGIFGNIYGQYSQLANARFWNTKSYDYPLVVNKGDVNQNAINEMSGSLNGTSLFVATNKSGYVNQMNGYVKDKSQIYQIRNVDGSINNNYYVDQETGNVYLRPPTLISSHPTTENQGPVSISNPISSPQYNVTLTPGADTITGVQNYNWGTINPGNRVKIKGQYTLDNINWTTIPETVKTLDSITGGTGSINFTIPAETKKVRWLGEVETDPPGTQQVTYNHTYDYTNLTSGTNNSNPSGVFDLSAPPGGTATATLTLKYVWNLPEGSPNNSSVNGKVQYSLDGGTNWTDLAGSNFSISPPPTNKVGTVTVNLPNGHPAMTANTMFRVVADVTAASPTVATEVLGPDSGSLLNYPPTSPLGLENIPIITPGANDIYYSAPITYDLSNAITPTTLNFSSTWNFTEGGSVDLVVQYWNGSSWVDVPNTSGTGTFTATANYADLLSVGAIGNSSATFQVKAVVTQGPNVPYPDNDLVALQEPTGRESVFYRDDMTYTLSNTPYTPSSLDVMVIADTRAYRGITGRLEYSTDGVNWNQVHPSTNLDYFPTSYDNDSAVINVNIPTASLPAYPTPFKIRWANYTDNSYTTLERSQVIAGYTINGSGETINLPSGYETALFTAKVTNSETMSLYGRYEYYDGSGWSPINGTDFALPPGSSLTVKATKEIPGITLPNPPDSNNDNLANGNKVRIGLYTDSGRTTTYTGSNASLSHQYIEYGMLDYRDMKILINEKFSTPRPAHLPEQAPNQTTISINKSYNTPPQLPEFSSTPNNLRVVKDVTINPGAAPIYQSGDFTLTGHYDSYNGITLPVGVTSNPNEAQYFGTSFYLDEVPKPEEFGQGMANNIKVKSAHPALFSSFPSGNSSDYSKADYLELIVNGVPIAVGNLDTSKIPAIVPGTNPQSALYRFSTDFTGGDLDFSPTKGSWSIDTTTGNTTSGQYVTDGTGYNERYHESVFNRLPLDNFIISTDIYVDNVDASPNPNPIGNATNFAGIRIRANSPGDPINQSGYLIAYENGQIKVLKGDDNVATFNVNVPSFGVGNKRNLKVHANGNDIQIYVDDTFVGQYIDPYNSYTSGYTSFVTAGRKVGYDNVSISSYASPIQLLSQALKKGENSLVVKAFGIKNVIVDVSGTIGGVNLSTTNIPPDLKTLNGGSDPDINSYLYKHSVIPGLQGGELEKSKAYWSASIKSSLGIAGKITFKNKEGGTIHKTKEEFSKVNSMMSNLTSLLGLMEDTFNSHLNIIR